MVGETNISTYPSLTLEHTFSEQKNERDLWTARLETGLHELCLNPDPVTQV